MTNQDLISVVVNVLGRAGYTSEEAHNYIRLQGFGEAVKFAAAKAYVRCLTEDDNTRKLRWQCGFLMDNGYFALEDNIKSS